MDLVQRARELYASGRMHDALEVAQAACDRAAKDAEAWALLGRISRHNGMPDHIDASLAGKQPEDAASRPYPAANNRLKDVHRCSQGSNDLTHDNFTTFFAVSPPRPSARVFL